MTGHIFLSYRSIEADFALKLAADLKNAGIKMWVDQYELRAGKGWRNSLAEAINDCIGMVVVLSPDYLTSQVCNDEIERARELGKPIYPVLLYPLNSPGDWPMQIQGIQGIKFYDDKKDWRETDFYSKQRAELAEVLSEHFKDATGDTPEPEIQYINQLIAELASRKGVLDDEYVSISAETGDVFFDDAGWDSSFVEVDLRNENRSQQVKTFPDIQAVLAAYKRFVLTGKPGAGKTTTLRRLALDSARAYLDSPRTAPLPLLLYLPHWASMPAKISFAEFIQAKWNLAGNPVDLLKVDKIKLYLDGLNEMGSSGGNRAKELKAWLEATPAKNVIITCRADDYTGDLDLALPAVEIQEMDETGIKQFAQNYLKERAASFLEIIFPDNTHQDTNRSLVHLARNPYMLSALIRIHQNGGELPRNQGALFRKLAQYLWERERERKTEGWIPFEQAEAAFAKLAFDMIAEDKPIDVSKDYAASKLGSEALLQVGVSANFLILNGKQVRFYHQLMQEYFAGVALQSVKLTREIIGYGYYMLDVKYGKWDEALIALCGLVADADYLINEIRLMNEALAARCIGNGINISQKLLDEIINMEIIEITDPSNIYNRRSYAANRLSHIGIQAVPALIKVLESQELDDNTVHMITRTLCNIESPLTIPSLLLVQKYKGDKYHLARMWAAKKLAEIGDISILEGFLNIIREEEWIDTLDSAVRGLVKIGEPAVDGLTGLLYSDSDTTRRYARSALIDIGEPAVLPVAKLLTDKTIVGKYKEKVCDIALDILTDIGTDSAKQQLKSRYWRRFVNKISQLLGEE